MILSKRSVILILISISISLLLISYLNPSNVNFIVFPFDLLMVIFVLVFFPTFSLLIYREKRIMGKKLGTIEKNPSSIRIELSLKYDIYRKLTHFVVLGVIFLYFTSGFLNQNLIVLLVGISLIGLLTADIVRILAPEIYPLKQINQILREKELHLRLGPHISMGIGCFSIILLYGLIQPIGPVIICTSMVMAIFGDITSNLVGRTIGHRRIRETKKTYEGLIAGIIVSFLSGISVLYLLRNFYKFDIVGLLLNSFIGAMIIGLLDYLDLEIDDNLSFIFCLSTVLFFISISLF